MPAGADPHRRGVERVRPVLDISRGRLPASDRLRRLRLRGAAATSTRSTSGLNRRSLPADAEACIANASSRRAATRHGRSAALFRRPVSARRRAVRRTSQPPADVRDLGPGGVVEILCRGRTRRAAVRHLGDRHAGVAAAPRRDRRSSPTPAVDVQVLAVAYPAGTEIDGPLLVTEPTTTVVVASARHHNRPGGYVLGSDRRLGHRPRSGRRRDRPRDDDTLFRTGRARYSTRDFSCCVVTATADADRGRRTRPMLGAGLQTRSMRETRSRARRRVLRHPLAATHPADHAAGLVVSTGVTRSRSRREPADERRCRRLLSTRATSTRGCAIFRASGSSATSRRAGHRAHVSRPDPGAGVWYGDYRRWRDPDQRAPAPGGATAPRRSSRDGGWSWWRMTRRPRAADPTVSGATTARRPSTGSVRVSVEIDESRPGGRPHRQRRLPWGERVERARARCRSPSSACRRTCPTPGLPPRRRADPRRLAGRRADRALRVGVDERAQPPDRAIRPGSPISAGP